MTKQKTNLPDGWQEVELGEIFIFEHKSGRKAGEGAGDGKYKFFTSSSEQSKSIDSFDYEGEHLILSTGGKAGIHYCNEKFSASNDCFVLKVDEKLLTKYIFYYLSGKLYLLEEGFKGAGLRHLSKEYLKKIKIIFPEDKETQKHIVQILEKAEHARQKREEADKLTKKYLKSVFAEMFGDPTTNDKKWSTDKLENLCKIKSGGTPSTFNKLFYNGTLPWITTVALGQKYIGDKNAQAHITKEAVEKSATKIIPANSVMIGIRVGVGKTSINTCEMCTSQDILSLTDIDKRINKEFLLQLLNNFLLHFESQKRGATIQGITSDNIKKLDAILPPLPLQQKFAKIVEHVEKLKEKQQKSKEKLDEMFNVLMQRAFKGELVR
jgi:type I restriction enzyme S subunit